MDIQGCTFCDIAAGRLPSTIHHEDEDFIVFENRLDWVPVMLLVTPRRHVTQEELWGSGSLMPRIAALALSMGQRHSPSGFRLLSNFGDDALQTQDHGHLHVVGGAYLGHYVRPPERR